MSIRTLASLGSLIGLLMLAGCATTTKIVSEPPGAKVLDSKGTELGTTPYDHESTLWLWEKDELELRKSGYASKKIEVSRNEIDVVPTIGSAALFVCLGFVPFGLTGVVLFLAGGMKFPEETTVKLEAGGSAGAEAAPAPYIRPTGLPETLLY